MTNLDGIFKSRDITLPKKVRLVKAMVFPMVMYGCESWTLKSLLQHHSSKAPVLRRSAFFMVQLSQPYCSLQLLSHVRLCDPVNLSTPGLPVHQHLPEFTQTHVHRVRDAIQPSHPRSPPSPPAPNPSQHQSLFQRVSSSHKVAKVLELPHQSVQ